MIPYEDLRVEIYDPWPGPGMKPVTRPMGVKVTHIPTGIAASSHVHHSQHKNKELCAMMILAALTDPKLAP